MTNKVQGEVWGKYKNQKIDPVALIQAVLDIVGVFDPSGAADGLNAGIYASKGDIVNAAISGIAAGAPYLGDAAKLERFGLKAGVKTAENYEKIAAKELYFSQGGGTGKGLSRATSGGIMLDDLAQDMASHGWNGSPLRVVEVEGHLTSLDNRRLAAAKVAGIEVPIVRVEGGLHEYSRDGWFSSIDVYEHGFGNRTGAEPLLTVNMDGSIR